ncbi:hypothetical protein PIB30_033528 [Stylosanthes scabra]|uniref:Uncharacterized protein n=1 Tax=Stylosanthes scabra TaxID=79078 RepID=A0ABU6SCK4_9FABA|nr:hypothetical protein [Stylosanthes scabra]
MVQEATAERAREANKGKAREFVPDSEEEDSEELASSASEECIAWSFIPRGNDTHFTVVLVVRFGALAEIGAYQFIGVEKSMRKAKKNIGSKNGLEKACKSGDFTKKEECEVETWGYSHRIEAKLDSLER